MPRRPPFFRRKLHGSQPKSKIEQRVRSWIATCFLEEMSTRRRKSSKPVGNNQRTKGPKYNLTEKTPEECSKVLNDWLNHPRSKHIKKGMVFNRISHFPDNRLILVKVLMASGNLYLWVLSPSPAIKGNSTRA